VVFQEEEDAYGSPTGERSEIIEFPNEAEEPQEEIHEGEEMDVEHQQKNALTPLASGSYGSYGSYGSFLTTY
jgi:hypothetical protein